MANVTYNDHPSGTTPDGTEGIPGWQAGGAKKFPFLWFQRLRYNPSLVSAAGTDQAGATALSNSYSLHIIGTVASGAGVKFAALVSGSEGEPRLIRVLGSAAANLLLYPSSGGHINDRSANVAITVEKGQSVLLYATSTVDWITVP